MADCSYSRCMQQRRNIKRELQRWTKNMVYIVGLERIAEELMGRRKWKLYQDSMQQRSYLQPLNNNTKPGEKHVVVATAPPPPPQPQPPIKNCRRASVDSDGAGDGDGGSGGCGGVDDAGDGGRQPLTNNNNNNISNNNNTITISNNNNHNDSSSSNHHNHAKSEDVDDDVADDFDDKVTDWSPTSKCIFCVDGKLDEHTNHGALSPRHSETESSEGGSDTEALPTLTPALLNHHHHHHHHHQQHHQHHRHRSMTALETSMVAMAAVALSGGAGGGGGNAPPAAAAAAHLPYYGPLAPHWFLANVARNLQPAAAATADEKTTTGEQPLDLSSKGGGGGGGGGSSSGGSTPNDNRLHMRLPVIDNKHIYKAKPRMSAVGGRRTYTEEELQAALRDIQSGKLGTRRAAVIYGIPRSTLRNKIAAEEEEELEGMDDDKELSGAEEEKEVEKALEAPLFTYDDLVNSDALKALLTKAAAAVEEVAPGAVAAAAAATSSSSSSSNENILGSTLHTLLLRTLVSNQMKLQQQQQQQQQQNNGILDADKQSPANSVVVCRTDKEDTMMMETDGDSGSNVILRIPSYRPTTAPTSTTTPPATSSCSTSSNHNSSSKTSESPPCTSPLPARAPLLQKDVKDLIAKSLSQKLQASPAETLRNPLIDFEMKRSSDYTPPPGGSSVSVIKSQEGRVYAHAHHHHHHQQPPMAKSTTVATTTTTTTSNSNSGGKGTRPKRGKYRNYDRDSLVEAVRAVQRGEMSVHRAGSYYGVPHSTLEYKVKERHLMRPRKRDPKPNPVDEKIASLRQSDLRNAAAAAAAAGDKTKTSTTKAVNQQQQKFASGTSPNGIKLPMYEPPLGQLGYSTGPFPFWPHAAYSHIPLDYGRAPAPAPPPPPPPPPTASAAGARGAPEATFFASQMMQKLHEDPRAHLVAAAAAAASAAAASSSGGANLSKTMREKAEALLDPGETNGLLDGIIRSSLESGVPSDDQHRKEDRNVAPENMSNKALLDQLCRNSRLTFKEHVDSDEDDVKAPPPPTLPPPSCDASSSSSPSLTEANGMLETMASTTTTTTTTTTTPRPGLIFLKQELTKPENLKPEMLMRFRDILQQQQQTDRNGIAEGSASESDAAQD